ncbi:MAG: divergent polysaccharide deacetylase family protein [Candidatus Eremiobacteraeota bacterium]|nr:divergent polysaccharide deacetylase family protein [Candidatus Eremiobacteraeota bacterium]
MILVSLCSVAIGWGLAQSRHRDTLTSHRHARLRVMPRAVQQSTPSTPRLAVVPTTAPPPTAAGTTAPETPSAIPAPSSSVRSPMPAAATGTARLAIIIDDCGQWLTTERALIALPIPLTVSIMPNAPYSSEVQRAARDAGQGIMLHLPMEPRAHLARAGGEITTAMDDATIAEQVRADLARVPLARGVNNHEGSKATADPRVMRDVAEVLAGEGRYFVDSRTTTATVAAKETAALNVPTASRNVFLDDVPTQSAIEKQLMVAAEVARAKGTAIAIGHPKETMLAALREESSRIEAQGVQFVLVQDVVQ